MGKVKKDGIESDQGFTMIELIIVIAILGILAAVLVPSFTQITQKSRLKADMTTARQVQAQIDLYLADNDGAYPTRDGKKPTTDTIKDVMTKLVEDEYIKKSDTVTEEDHTNKGDISYQTKGLATGYNDGEDHIIIDLKGADPKVKKIASKLTPKEKEWVAGYDKD